MSDPSLSPAERTAEAPRSLRGPDWAQANPRHIQRALDYARSLPGGGWYVVAASRAIGKRPRPVVIAGRELVVWRCANGVVAAPEACPHMGASLAGARVAGEIITCPWHGLQLGPKGHGAWRPFPTHDDGVLVWVQLPGEEPTARPHLPPRPAAFVDAVMVMSAKCEPDDIIANRLDPWHGAHFHPYSFSDLEVLEATDEKLTLDVTKRIIGPIGVPVRATFHCSDPRTIVMTIVDGQGAGSVVETHATPTLPGEVLVIEATMASSDRPGFALARALSPVVRPLLVWAARRLWVDDVAYAERLRWLREQGRPVFSPAAEETSR